MFRGGRQVFQVGQAPSGPTVIRPLIVLQYSLIEFGYLINIFGNYSAWACRCWNVSLYCNFYRHDDSVLYRIGLLFVSRIRWRREDFCRLEQRSVVPPLQSARPILHVLNKLKINIIPNFRPSNAATWKVQPEAAALLALPSRRHWQDYSNKKLSCR